MVGLIGIEPMTSTMSTWRSNQLSYNPLAGFIIHIRAKKARTFFRFESILSETNMLFVQKQTKTVDILLFNEQVNTKHAVYLRCIQRGYACRPNDTQL